MQRSLPTSLALMVLALSGCAGEVGTAPRDFDEGATDDASEVGVVDEALYGNSNYYWTSSAGTPVTIPVCWENSTTGNATARGWIRAAIERTWQRNGRLNFSGWLQCLSGQQAVRVRLEDVASRSDGRTPGPATGFWRGADFISGRLLLGEPDGLRLNPTYTSSRSPAWCRANSTQLKACIDAHAVHEFGHVLGFYHEEERDDYIGGPAPNCGDQSFQNASPAHYGSYDIDSVMSYCGQPTPETWHWTLSSNDIASLQRVYGRRIPGSIVTPNGNCLESDAEASGSSPAIVRACTEQQGDQEWDWNVEQLKLDTNRCLRQPAIGSPLGTNVVSTACSDALVDNWRFENVEVRGWGSLCLDLPNGNTTNGTPIQVFRCGALSGANQHWSVTTTGEIHFGGPSSNKCVTGLGASLFIWDCNSPDFQRFSFRPSGQIRFQKFTDLCLEVMPVLTADPRSADMPSSGEWVEVHTCTSKTSQYWNFSGPIKHSSTARCLERESSTDANGTPAEVNTCNGGSNETWDYYFR